MANLRQLPLLSFLLLLPVLVSASDFGGRPAGLSDEALARHTRQIDGFVELGLLTRGIPMRPPAPDTVFVRRAHLDIAGRIPTLEETREFLGSRDPRKRRDLVRSLLDSEAYVSREFNYWADLLRLRSSMNNVPGQPYVDWVKNALRINMPYDRMVRELIGAEGYIWDNGAAGFYLRDAGMELDHLANTFQVFLGTQLVCAQCHDHPYDDFTQLDYYRQAAYIYGVQTNDRSVSRQYRKISGRPDKEKTGIDPRVHQRARQLIRPLRYRVHDTERQLRLPDDYQYEDAKPRSEVDPSVIFGETPETSGERGPRDIYAAWLASSDNPRFATVIANRLWKRAMGVGLIEPVDDLSDGYKASHPELMDYLAELMIELRFDLRDYMYVLYNTRTYQQEVSEEDPDPGQGYHFAGRPLMRMSAEQIWDSLATLVVPDIDERKGNPVRNRRYEAAIGLRGKSTGEIVEYARLQLEREDQRAASSRRERNLRARIAKVREEGNKEELDRLQRQLGQLARQREQAQPKDRSGSDDPRWKGIPSQYVRASELPSPAPGGHFLRQFGQSDRETIENANDDANVPQVLTLLNGSFHAVLRRNESLLRRNLESAGNRREVLDVLFLSILAREPTMRERLMLLPHIDRNRQQALQDIAWALVNTRQFLFVQ